MAGENQDRKETGGPLDDRLRAVELQLIQLSMMTRALGQLTRQISQDSAKQNTSLDILVSEARKPKQNVFLVVFNATLNFLKLSMEKLTSTREGVIGVIIIVILSLILATALVSHRDPLAAVGQILSAIGEVYNGTHDTKSIGSGNDKADGNGKSSTGEVTNSNDTP